jgi:hypothetical protein
MAQTWNEWALRFFQNSATGESTDPVYTVDQLGTLTPLGYKQIPAASTAAAFTLATAGLATTYGAGIPPGATLAVISPEAQGIRWRDDGTVPTAAIGYRLLADNELLYYGPLASWSGINIVAGAIVNIVFY